MTTSVSYDFMVERVLFATKNLTLFLMYILLNDQLLQQFCLELGKNSLCFKIPSLSIFYASCPERVCFLFDEFILKNNPRLQKIML